MAKDVKIFKLKARGDAGASKTELLVALGRICRSFGMQIELKESDHHLIITSTKAQRCALYDFNRAGAAAVEKGPPL
ncbi:MAG TPA: hypothetical protein VKW08_07980 [Xanthobacteraceae bacterium]|jgi:hypothetical protein|nr:hypothetical protein [Xanthobacteraceae bacterium]